jgi:hypothetical protein
MNKEELAKEIGSVDSSIKAFNRIGGRACLIVGEGDDIAPFYFKNDGYLKEVITNILLLHKEHCRQELAKLDVQGD